MKLWAVLFFFFCDLLQNYTENLDIIFIIPLSISLRKIIIEDLKISIIVNIKIFKGGKKYWNTFESKLDLDSWYFLAHLSISRVWRDIYQWSMIQPWIHCSRRSWRPLRLSRSRWAFQEIARNLYASVLSVFELRLIKKKKKERKPWIPVTFIVDQHIPLNTYTRADILHGRNLRYHRHHHRFLTSVIYTLL